MANNPLPDDYRSRDYPIKEDMPFQRFAWKMQKLGFLMLFLFIIAACLGLFSQGVLSDTSTLSPSGKVRLAYDRFARNTSDTNLIIHIKVAKENTIRLSLGGDILDNYAIEYIQPAPKDSFISNKALHISQPITSKDSWHSIYITLKPNRMGYFSHTITLENGETIAFNQLVYP